MTALFQQLPSVDKILKTPQGLQLITKFGHTAVVATCRELLTQARQFIQKNNQLPEYFSNFDRTFVEIHSRLQKQNQVQIKAVHNLTGTVLHTNLGRALWSEAAQQAALSAMQKNVSLEYDLDEGKRSHRDNYISELLCKLTGAEAACIVNNNTQGKEVIISRGELIEIGGAFRIPDIMEQARCHLVEVGTTNRTHLKDYRNAITENTAFLMKVHSSNYQICGFTSSVSEEELAELGREMNVPVVTDLGSGALIDLSQYGLPKEPTVQEKIAQGVDLVSFSGDKLLGGVQAGIIVGKKEWIEQLQAHPLKRALRCDKVILAGLEATLRLYLNPEKLTEKLPTLRLLTQSLEQLKINAMRLKERLESRLNSQFELQIEASQAQIGSGSQPMERIPSVAVTIAEKTNVKLSALSARFKQFSQPIIGRMENGKIWLDLRSLADIETLLNTLDEL
ncbi:L-seryl-tRNA(Sec) selenium transferase [Haemophilus influenzae]|uniref:L-seryl-tRNA(Sec) selenium transferase n=1 Tax=Haemophilus influenzae TaxID=727 RepID=UPI003D7EFD84